MKIGQLTLDEKKPETDLAGQNIKDDAFVQGTWDFLDEITIYIENFSFRYTK